MPTPRVMINCNQLGEAAGIAATQVVQRELSSKNLIVSDIQQELFGAKVVV